LQGKKSNAKDIDCNGKNKGKRASTAFRQSFQIALWAIIYLPDRAQKTLIFLLLAWILLFPVRAIGQALHLEGRSPQVAVKYSHEKLIPDFFKAVAILDKAEHFKVYSFFQGFMLHLIQSEPRVFGCVDLFWWQKNRTRFQQNFFFPLYLHFDNQDRERQVSVVDDVKMNVHRNISVRGQREVYFSRSLGIRDIPLLNIYPLAHSGLRVTSLHNHENEHSTIYSGDTKSRYDVAFNPPVRGLWGCLDYVNPVISLCMAVICIGFGGCVMAWSIYEGGNLRTWFGLAGGIIWFVVGGNILCDFVLRVSS
jgi:hypothetical protein